MTELKKCCDACEEQLSIYDGSGFICRNVYCECHTTTQPTVRMSEPSLQGTCSKGVCCTIQYGEDAGVCMLDNCSCHTPKKCCRKCEDTPPNHGCYFCYCHTTPTVEPTDCCGKCEPGDSGLHTKCLLPSCECHSPTETGWEEKIPFQKHDKQCGYATCDSRVMIDFIHETLAIQKEELLKELEGIIRLMFIDSASTDEEVWRNKTIYEAITIIKNLKGGV